MRSLGIALQKNFMRYSVLEGTKAAPVLIHKGKLSTTSPDEIPELMDWFDTQFSRLISEFRPDIIGYKLTLRPELEQIHTLSFPFGLLNLIAHKNGITIKEFSTAGITPNKLNLPKGTDLHQYIDSTIGIHAPHWDSTQKDSVLVSWFCL